MRRISLFLIAGVIAIAVYVGVNSFETLTVEPEADLARLQLDYDAYSDGINTVLYDVSGAINYTLQADHQVHFNDDSTELEKPFIRLYEDGKTRWNIVADYGRISSLRVVGTVTNDTANTTATINTTDTIDTTEENLQSIELSGDIEVYSLDDLGNRMQMTTDYLTLDPHNKTMETDRLVTVVTNSIQLTSTGMFADLNQDEVVLKREIRGSYDITPN